MEDKKSLMKEKIEILNRASKAYYQDAEEMMSNFEYDKLYDELAALEAETGMILAGSPTQNVGYEVLSDLPKERHPERMLSLDKTKDRQALAEWLAGQKGILSWKLDGLTIVLTYEEGKLVKALTRGNGDVGEVITNNARVFANVPVEIPHKGRLVLRGEAVIKYSDFEKINASIGDADAKYKNPRNLCSGSVRQLNNRITAERNVNFFAFSLVEAAGVDFAGSRQKQMMWLCDQGFDVVEYRMVDAENVVDAVGYFEAAVADNDLPSDGLVLSLDDIHYSRSLGTTAKFPRDSIAFKWQDQVAETTLKEIEWSASRTGLINPVAIFEPVELEGTTVSRASVHNISVMRDLKLGLGDTITVYKANMIIPQIAENLTGSNDIEVPENCPVCGEQTTVKNDNGVETLYCTNEACLAKQIKRFTLFVSRDAMNIDGLSEATIEKLIAKGLIRELADLFALEQYREQITAMEGFGEKSFENLASSIEKAKDTTPERLLYSLGIPGIGVANAKVIVKACGRKWDKAVALTREELIEIDGIGEIMADAYVSYFDDDTKRKEAEDVRAMVRLDETEEETADFLEGKTFVITGSLQHYENRDALKAEIQRAGGKVAGSVSAKTAYLINNDLQSTSGKNKKAKELGIPIIDEETIKTWIETGVIEDV
ncbi:NAD-dependent DNA ligase LigA [Emergencia sp. 1XD21-10]|uniref:NAD-dependent DNA ligase LigA n=1 Tax=Emergencia sp. 1XD21-10 TaxID=2304569 RepID=UPI00137A3079|nr:NAD-dependent DNA ligase LigA [Emergencia sp. 1XD21-10]MCI9639521.1 NAD-dependent DNA ligase LigA [Emergencia sp.]NCE98772.1 NAD-dependent DNA ligase LigA [Emergencia sp. 1XD21-10]